MRETFEKQTGASQQEESERDFADYEGMTQAMTPAARTASTIIQSLTQVESRALPCRDKAKKDACA
jgi:hypothetical protein